MSAERARASDGPAARALGAFWTPAVVSGALLWSAFPPLDLGTGASILGFAVLLGSMRVRAGRRAAGQAFVAAMIWFLAGFRWIQPLVSVGWVVVAAWCAAHEALFARFLRPSLRAAHVHRGFGWVLVAPALHVGLDMVRTVLLTGFPWLLPGYSAWENPVLVGSADLIGVHGATFAIVAAAAALAEVAARAAEARPWRWRPLVPAAVVWALLAGWAWLSPAPEERPGPNLLLLQAAIPQELKEDRERRGGPEVGDDVYWSVQEDVLAAGLDAADRAGRRVDAVVWPETMLPFPALAPLVPGRPLEALEVVAGGRRVRTSDAPRRRLVQGARGRPTLGGVVTVDVEAGRRRNTAVLLDQAGTIVAHQDKQHLTPGGETLLVLERLPDDLRVRVEEWLIRWAGFVPDLEGGEGPALLPLARAEGTVRLGVLICYESIFPEISRRMTADGADVLVNLSNYGWFAGTEEMAQCLAMAVFRAAEMRRPLVLASNNGISAVIGPDGTVRARTEADERTSLLAEVPLASGRTPFAALGEWAAWGLGALGAAAALRDRRRAPLEPPRT